MCSDTLKLNQMCIFFPNALFSDSYLDNHLKNSELLPFVSDDENAVFKISLAYAIAKTIELASVFKRVYLEQFEYQFIVSNMIKTQKNIALYLLRNEKISYVDDHHWGINYNYSDGQHMQVSKKDKMNCEALRKSIFREISNSKDIERALHLSFSKRIILQEEVDIPLLCDICENDLRLGYFQSLGITKNGYITIDDGNIPVYDAVLQAEKNAFLCDSYHIPAIYNHEVNQFFFQSKIDFLDSLSRISVKKTELIIHNITKAIMSHNKAYGIIEYKRLINSYESKNIKALYVDGMHKYLKYYYFCEVREEINNTIVFVDSKGESNVLIRSGKEIINDLEQKHLIGRKTHLIIKILPRKYAEQFIKQGKMKFSFPSNWVEEGKKGNIGQGDLEEGIIGRNADNTIIYRDNDSNAVLHNLAYCCYGLDNVMFNMQEITPGVYRKSSSVSYSYFKDFYTNEAPSPEYEPVIILIQPDTFVRKLYDSLIKKYKLKSDSISITQIVYIDKSAPFMLKCEYPMELNFKGLEFISQNEIRIIIKDDGSDEFKQIVDNNGVISIGRDLNLDQTAFIVERYNEDMKCFIDGDKLIFNLP